VIGSSTSGKFYAARPARPAEQSGIGCPSHGFGTTPLIQIIIGRDHGPNLQPPRSTDADRLHHPQLRHRLQPQLQRHRRPPRPRDPVGPLRHRRPGQTGPSASCARGTTFIDNSQLDAIGILRRYALIAEHFDDHAQFARGVPGKPKDRFKESRPISKEARQVVGQMLPVKPTFFLNDHHRETCRTLYPSIVSEIDLPMHLTFAGDRRERWMREFDRMDGKCVEQAKVLLFYILACGRR
jgi:hypothetical protein